MYEFHRLKIKNIQQETKDAVVWTLDVPNRDQLIFNWKAGQHLTFRHLDNGEELRRSYSILSPTRDGEIKILIKKVQDGKFSDPAQTEYQVGQEVEVMPPTGHFCLSAENDTYYVFIAAGSGITPIMSMIYEVMHHSNSHVNLYYGNSTVEGTLLKRQLTDLKDKYPERLSVSYFLSREPIDIDLYSGRIDADKMNKIFHKEIKSLDVSGFYLCGPGEMINNVSNALKEQGVSPDKVHSEYFLSEDQVIRDSSEKASVTDSGVMVTIDGVTSRYEIKEGDETSLLDAALQSGVNMPYSCMAGVCATCRCKLVEGEVEMLNNYSLEDWELEQGYILSCQSIPKTKKIVIDYDS